MIEPRNFTDQHCHGYAGVDFATSDIEAIRRVVDELQVRETTSVTASLPTMSVQAMVEAIERLIPLVEDGTLAGIHLEGPFLAHNRCGAHPSKHLLMPDSVAGQRALNALLTAGGRTITSMTYAPELPGASGLEKELLSLGIQPSPGHTDANAEEMMETLSRLVPHSGAPVVITHVFNAMRGFHHRDPGPLPVLLQAAASGDVLMEIIADGHHVSPDVVKWCFQLVPEAMRVVSDASAASGATPGIYQLGELDIQTMTHSAPRLYRNAEGEPPMASGAVDLLDAFRRLTQWGVDPHLALSACQR